MWRPDRAKLLRIHLRTCGEDAETVLGEDCGPAPAPPGGRFVRIASVPFKHAKPTYGDVVAAGPEPGGDALGWDSEGVSYEEIAERLLEDGGRWTMILDYEPANEAVDTDVAFAALERACSRAEIATESCYGPLEGEPGRVYLAVPSDLAVQEVLAYLDGQALPLTLILVHPVAEGERSGRR